MSATKFRPSNYNEVVGASNLISLLKATRLAGVTWNAYTFSGQYGSGKTTIARIFVKSILCQDLLKDGSPCGVCKSCRAMDAGSHPSYMEIDAATQGTKENILSIVRDLRYQTMDGKPAVVLIDEAHGISREGKDALLKTLEEEGGSERAIFILCTNERAKMPKTLLSRAMEFPVPSPTRGDIIKRLEHVCQKMTLEYELGALELLADGLPCNYRESENILPMLKVLGGATEENVSKVLPIDVVGVAEMLAVLPKDLGQALEILEDLSRVSNASTIIQAAVTACVDSLRQAQGAITPKSGAYGKALSVLYKGCEGRLELLIDRLMLGSSTKSLSFLQADLVSLHHKLFKGLQLDAPSMEGLVSTSVPEAKEVKPKSFWEPTRSRKSKKLEESQEPPLMDPERGVGLQPSLRRA